MHTPLRNTFTTYFTEQEEKKLFKTLRESATLNAKRDLAWMRVLRNTGMRIEALAGANVGDAKDALRENRYYIRPELLKGHKGGNNGHYITVNNALRQALKSLLSIRKERLLIQGDDAPLIVSRKNRRMGVRAYQHAMTIWCKKAELSAKASPHWWRHTLAKRVMNNSTAEDPRGVVMSILCHRDYNASAIYTLPDKEVIEQTMREISK